MTKIPVLTLLLVSLSLYGMDEQEHKENIQSSYQSEKEYLQSLPELPEETQQEIDYEYLLSLPPVPANYYDEPISAEDIQKKLYPILQCHINKFLIGDGLKSAQEFIAALNIKLNFEDIINIHTTSDKKILILHASNCRYKNNIVIPSVNKVYIVNFEETTQNIIEHVDIINKIEVSSDDKHVITASDDGTLKIYDLEYNQETVIEHHGCVISFEVSLDNNFLVTISEDRTSKIIDLQTKQQINEIKYQRKPLSVRFNADNSKIIAFSLDGQFYVYDMQTQELSLISNKQMADIIKTSSDNKFMITYCYKNEIIKIYNLITKQELTSFKYRCDSIKISKNNKLVFLERCEGYYGNYKKTLKIYDLENNENIALLEHYDNDDGYNVSEDINSNNLVTISGNKAKIYNLNTQKEYIVEFDNIIDLILVKHQNYFVVLVQGRVFLHNFETKKTSILNIADGMSEVIKIWPSQEISDDKYLIISYCDMLNLKFYSKIYALESQSTFPLLEGVGIERHGKYLVLGLCDKNFTNISFKIYDIEENKILNISVKDEEATFPKIKIIENKVLFYFANRIEVYDLHTEQRIDIIPKDTQNFKFDFNDIKQFPIIKDKFKISQDQNSFNIERLDKSILYNLNPFQIDLIKWLCMQDLANKFRAKNNQEVKRIMLNKKMIEVFESLPAYVQTALLQYYPMQSSIRG